MAILRILILVLFATPAHADPISAGVGAVFAFFATNVATQAIGSLLLSAALSYAGSLFTSSGKQKSNASSINKPEVRLSTRQSIPPKRDIYGEVLSGGAMFYEECKPPWLYMGLMMSDGPIDSIVGFQVNQTLINVDYPTRASLTALYSGNLFVSFRNGDFDQAADPLLLADFPELGANFRNRGVSTIAIKAYFGNDQDHYQKLWGQQQKPNVLARVRGKLIYDPRDPTQSLPTVPNNFEAFKAAYRTWKWTNNASLIIADYLWSANGGRVPLNKMRWDYISESADFDDGLFGTLAEALPVVTSGPANGFFAFNSLTMIDRSVTIPLNSTVEYLGFYSAIPTAGAVKIMNRVSAALYDVLYTKEIYHPGGGWKDFKIDPVVIPSTGDYKIAVYVENGFSAGASVARASVSGDTQGTSIVIPEDTASTIPTRASYTLTTTEQGPLIKRHTIDGVVNADQEPYQILTSMLRANRGQICRHEGMVWVQSSQPQEPVLTITDDMIIGALQFRRSQPREHIIKRSRVRFIDPRRNWSTVDGPIRTDPTWVEADGEKYDGVLDLPWTSAHQRAQRLNKAFMDDSQLGRQVTTMLAVRALGLTKGGELIAGRAVRIQSAIATRANGLYRIIETGLAEGQSAIEIVLKEYDPNIELSWRAVDEQAFTLPPEIET